MEQVLSQSTLNFEITAESDLIDTWLSTLVDIKGSKMIISSHGIDKFTIRNRKDLSIINIIEHDLGILRFGLCYPE